MEGPLNFFMCTLKMIDMYVSWMSLLLYPKIMSQTVMRNKIQGDTFKASLTASPHTPSGAGSLILYFRRKYHYLQGQDTSSSQITKKSIVL